MAVKYKLYLVHENDTYSTEFYSKKELESYKTDKDEDIDLFECAERMVNKYNRQKVIRGNETVKRYAYKLEKVSVMKNPTINIKVGQIWQVETDSFLTSGNDDRKNGRQLKINKFEKIEIRYPFAWHFRTVGNEYYHAYTDMILENYKLFGEVKPEIKDDNKANLEEILRLKLYNKKQKIL